MVRHLARKTINRHPRLKSIAKRAVLPLRKVQHDRLAKTYARWLSEQELSDEQLKYQQVSSSTFAYQPLISVVVPVYDTPGAYFRTMFESVLSQTYSNWELILVDDASPHDTIRGLVNECVQQDSRVRAKFLRSNLGIAGATNEAIRLARGDYVTLFDHDDRMTPDALFEIVKALNEHDRPLFIYTDEDKIDSQTSRRMQPFFKPDWNPDLLFCINYITHLTTIQRELLQDVGGEDGNFDGAQDWELFLRITGKIDPSKIHHIRRVLYSWRVHEGSTASSLGAKPYVIEAQRRALESTLTNRKTAYESVVQHPLFPGQWIVTYSVPKPEPHVLVLVESIKDLKHLQSRTQYENLAVRVAGQELKDLQELLVEHPTADYIVFAKKRLHIQDPQWLRTLIADARRKEVGFVLAKSSDDEAIQNYSALLNERESSLLASMSHLSNTRHIAVTARYDFSVIKAGVAVVAAHKLAGYDGDASLEAMSAFMERAGLRNLYNPTVRVLK